MYFQHDSLDITYRRPQGAVKAGQEVELSVRAADIYGEVFLLLQDRAGERLVPLWPAGRSGSWCAFEPWTSRASCSTGS